MTAYLRPVVRTIARRVAECHVLDTAWGWLKGRASPRGERNTGGLGPWRRRLCGRLPDVFCRADKRSGRLLGSVRRASFHPLPSAFHDLFVLCFVLFAACPFFVACLLRDRSSHGNTATSNVQLTWVGVSWHLAPRKFLRQVTWCSR